MWDSFSLVRVSRFSKIIFCAAAEPLWKKVKKDPVKLELVCQKIPRLVQHLFLISLQNSGFYAKNISQNSFLGILLLNLYFRVQTSCQFSHLYHKLLHIETLQCIVRTANAVQCQNHRAKVSGLVRIFLAFRSRHWYEQMSSDTDRVEIWKCHWRMG